MRVFNKKDIFTIIVVVLLTVSLIVVVVLGEKKQSKASKELLMKIDELTLSKDDKNDSKENNDKESIPSVTVKEYIYKGANALGQYNNNRWKNKKWYAIGDNVKNVNGYTAKVKTLAGVNVVVSDASDGRVMGDMSKNITSEKLKDVDLVTVFAGGSDYSLDVPLGTIKDDESINTFYGNTKKLINSIIEAKSDANIVFITPIKQSANPNKNGVKLESYVQAINDVCKSYNILVLDMYSKSGIDDKNIKTYAADNVSLNTQGTQKVSQLISDYIKTIK